MKLNLRYLSTGLGLLFSGMLFVSCEQDTTDYVSNVEGKPVATIAQTTYTAGEDESIPVTVTLSSPAGQPVHLMITLVDENNVPIDVDSDDFTIEGTHADISDGFGVNGYVVTIPANTTSYTFNINPELDAEVEETETIRLRVSATRALVARVDPASEYLTITLNHVPQDFLTLVFDWEHEFDVDGTMFSLCESEYDMDFYVIPDGEAVDAGNAIDGAATADCPESISMSLADYPDGEYHIYQNVWDDADLSLAGISPAFDIPVRVHYSRGGSTTLDGTYTQNAAHVVNSDFGSDPNALNLIYVVSVRIQDGVFTLFDDNGNVASGRINQTAPVNRVAKSFEVQKTARR